MNRAYLAHVLRANRFRLLLVAIGLVVWGSLLPIIYDAFGQQFRSIMDSGIIPPQFAQFGGGDIFSLTGSVALGFIHPFAVALNLVFAVGFAGAASYFDGHLAVISVAWNSLLVNWPVRTTSDSSLKVSGTTPV